MSLRTLKRNIARNRMKQAGVERINKKRIWKNDFRKTRNGWTGGNASYFAINWRKWLDPTTAEYKMWKNGKTGKKKRLGSIRV